MNNRVPPAIDTLRNQRSRMNAEWSRLLVRPIRLRDGTVLFTLKDAAQRILDMPATASSRVAAERIIEAALHGGDMMSTHAAVRLALLKPAAVGPRAAASVPQGEARHVDTGERPGVAHG